ncbi:MAG: nuclear transport factor 2 family protein [bacterium]|nr:nuclear transport factor 2 family protein [bacterium]
MRGLTLFSVVLIMAFTTTSAIADHHLEAEKEAIVKIEKEWAKALVEDDTDWFKKTLADDYKSVFPDGEVWDRERFIDALATGEMDCSEVEILDLDVRVLGDVAIVIGHYKVAGNANGNPFASKDKWTDVFMKMDGTWKCVSSHGCTLSE